MNTIPRRLDMGRVITRTAQLIAANFLALLPLTLLVPILQLASTYYQYGSIDQKVVEERQTAMLNSGNFEGFFLWLMLTLVVLMGGYLLAYGAIIHTSLAVLRGERASLLEALRASARFFPQNLLWTIALGAAFMCLLIPGVIVSCVYAVLVPALMAEKKGLNAATVRASQLTDGSRWRIFWLLVLTYGINLALAIPTFVLNQFIPGWMVQVASIPLQCLSHLVLVVWLAVLYFELIELKEGGEGKVLADVFA